MKNYSRTDLADSSLSTRLRLRFTQSRNEKAETLADLAEFDSRRLYAPAAYDSTFAYCVGEFQMTADVALKWIRAARAARRFPVLFEAVADGRLTLSAVAVLKRHLTEDNVGEFLANAAHKTRREIGELLETRLRSGRPRLDFDTDGQLAPGPVRNSPASTADGERRVMPEAQLAPATQAAAPPRYPMQFSIDQETQNDLRYLQGMLGHRAPGGDVATIFARSLRVYAAQVDRQRFGVCCKPRKSRGSANPRYVPAEVRRAVYLRDDGQCTFVSAEGRRCESREVEFDHVIPVARGGGSTVGNVRLLCRTHNQYAAEQAFGRAFMKRKREEGAAATVLVPPASEPRSCAQSGIEVSASEAAPPAQPSFEARIPASAPVVDVPVAIERGSLADRVAAARARAAEASEEAQIEDGVFRALRALGYEAKEASDATRFCEDIADAPLGEQVKVALQYFHPKREGHSLPLPA